jgi:ABC transport system ATP-binding/permease protein
LNDLTDEEWYELLRSQERVIPVNGRSDRGGPEGVMDGARRAGTHGSGQVPHRDDVYYRHGQPAGPSSGFAGSATGRGDARWPEPTGLREAGPPERGRPRGPASGIGLARPAPTGVIRTPVRLLRIGRARGNDVVVPHPSVSFEHAELRNLGGGRYGLTDLGSHYGTYVNGRRIGRAFVTERDVIGIGRATFRLANDEPHGSIGGAWMVASDLTVELADGKVLLDRVSLPFEERSLVAILGPSGAGKSTLLGALTGMRPATSGTVLYGNRDLYAQYAELRHRIGLVPQENVLHTSLSARRALRYAAGLRFPGAVPSEERRRRVDEVLGELGLTAHARTRTSSLSGGQQKRVNVALELLTKPSLLFLDEPTSGLDPGSTKSVWEMMRALADDGRTVIAATHEVAHLHLCDRVLMLVPLLEADGDVIAGGQVAYYGPPKEGLEFFGEPDWAAVFEGFAAGPARDRAAEFADSRYHRRYVTAGLARLASRPAAREPESALEPRSLPRPRGRLGQFFTLCSRYLAVIAADRLYVAYTALLPVVLGLTLRVLSNSQGLIGRPHANTNAQLILVILALAASLNGASSSVQELIRERAGYHRERAAGLSAGAYLCSKFLVLAIITVAQAAVLVAIGLAGFPRPPSGVVLASPIAGMPAAFVELWLATALLSVVSMAVGLFISASARTIETVFQLLVGLTLSQVVMSGGARQLTGLTGLDQLSYLFPARWSYGATASSVNLGTIGAGLNPDPLWQHTPAAWFTDMGALAGFGLIIGVVTWYQLISSGSGRRPRVPAYPGGELARSHSGGGEEEMPRVFRTRDEIPAFLARGHTADDAGTRVPPRPRHANFRPPPGVAGNSLTEPNDQRYPY